MSAPSEDVGVAAALARAAQALAAGRGAEAEAAVREILAAYPHDVGALRMQVTLLKLRGRHRETLAPIRALLQAAPDDAALHNGLAVGLQASGDKRGALDAFRRASALAPEQAVFHANLGKALIEAGDVDGGVAALDAALAVSPDLAPARYSLAYVHFGRGDSDGGQAQLRQIVAHAPGEGRAWLGLADLGVRASESDIENMQTALAAARGPARIALGFALARAYEMHERPAEAWPLFVATNRSVHAAAPWDRAAEHARCSALLAPLDDTGERAPATLGREVIFIVGMPRSGSTLVEQILASHSAVEGGGELPIVMQLLEEESNRRGQIYTDWAERAKAADWERLGREYLARTAHLRTSRAHSTDKRPGNWRMLGAIRRMLPAARIVACRRDPVETVLGCFVRLFVPGTQRFAYDLADLAAYWHNFDDAIRFWSAREPAMLREQHYEALVADPQNEIRALLAHCALPFESACLDFHATARTVRTQSALQVRRPLRAGRLRAACYGPWIDPLKRALARPDR